VAKRYRDKVVGDSPEMCRALDAYGFADLSRCTQRMRALTSVYAWDDERRFKFGTPAEVWRTLMRCWEIEPTSARIVADITDFPFVLAKIIEHKGCVVPEDRLRHGHRLLAHNGGRVLSTKFKNRQRKETMTMGVVHPDAKEALQILLQGGEAADNIHQINEDLEDEPGDEEEVAGESEDEE
jgi:hypothetical protein